MAEHNVLTGASLHEPKGVASAAADLVYVSDGAGSGVWQSPELFGQSSATVNQLVASDGAGGVQWVNNSIDVAQVLSRSELTDQNPTATDTPLQILFGGVHSTTEFDIDAAGAITCNVTGSYNLRFNFRFARTSGTGNAILVARYLINGAEAAPPITAELTGAGDVYPYAVSVQGEFTAGQILTVELIRDSAGNDDGGVHFFNPTLAGWGSVPSAAIAISKGSVG